MAAKDKTPNRTLSVALDLNCDYQQCEQHGTVSSTNADGTIKHRCIAHLNPITSDNYLLKFLGLA